VTDSSDKKQPHSLEDHLLGMDPMHSHEEGEADHDHDHDDLGVDYDPTATSLWAQDNITLTSVGIDIGSAGTQVVFSRVQLRRLSEDLTSRYYVVNRETLYQSPVALTPYVSEERIDDQAIGGIVDEAYATAGVHPDDVDTGAVILTGEALRRENAKAIAEVLADVGGEFVCAAAGHHMESMLAAYGSGAAKVSHDRDMPILNIDIGGGTTKLALVEHGNVLHTAAIHIGGRLAVIDAAGRLTRLDPAGRRLAALAGFDWNLGDTVSDNELDRVTAWMADALVTALTSEPAKAGPHDHNKAGPHDHNKAGPHDHNKAGPHDHNKAGSHDHNKAGPHDHNKAGPHDHNKAGPYELSVAGLWLTEPLGVLGGIKGTMFSGGVGEYVYGREERDFGDLGRRLGRAIRERVDSGRFPFPLLPAGECIRATALGASEYSVQLSGNTIYISKPGELLPRKNLQVIQPCVTLGDIVNPSEVAAAIRSHFQSFDLVDGDSEVALAFRWRGAPAYPRLAAFARGIVDALPRTIQQQKPIFIVLDGDVAQTIGALLKEELGVRSEVLVLDGISLWDFDYIDLGRVRMPSFTVPVTIKSLVFSADPRIPPAPSDVEGHKHHHHRHHGHEHHHHHSH
jgi:ethanolamine utilization protein EutA